MNATQAVVLANAFSENAFGVTAWNFLMSDESTGFASQSSAARITLREFLRGNTIHGSTGKTEFQWVWENMKNNSNALIMSMIGIPIAFGVAKKVLRKPVILPANRALKWAGLNQVKLG